MKEWHLSILCVFQNMVKSNRWCHTLQWTFDLPYILMVEKNSCSNFIWNTRARIIWRTYWNWDIWLWSKLPILAVLSARGLRKSVVNLRASNLISMMLLSRQHRGPRGNAATNIVRKPNCNTVWDKGQWYT